MATAAHIELSLATAGVYHVPDITTEASEICSQLLQENHDRYHIFFNLSRFHNHIVHHLVTIWALGATPAELQKAYDNNRGIQRLQFPVHPDIVRDMANRDQFKEFLGQEQYFHDYEVFFRNEIEAQGWEAVLNEHLFARDEHADRMLTRMFAGFYHPLIHLGFGVEFKQPAIIVEALAQAAVHDGWVAKFLHDAEQRAAAQKTSTPSKSLVQLMAECRANDKLRKSPHWEDDNKVRDGIFVRAPDEMVQIAAQWRVEPDELEQKTAEMINAVAYFSGAAQSPPRQVKFDFFYMHCANCSLFFSVFLREPWLRVEDKCRLLEWKGRLDLALYVSRGSPTLLVEEVTNYQAKQPEHGWDGIIRRVDAIPDDGHASKLVRALANGERACQPFEAGVADDVFPIKGDMWLKLGHMAIDSVEAGQPRWVRGTGFEQAWRDIPERGLARDEKISGSTL